MPGDLVVATRQLIDCADTDSFGTFWAQQDTAESSNDAKYCYGDLQLSSTCRTQDIRNVTRFHVHVLGSLLLPASIAAEQGLLRHMSLLDRLSEEDYLENQPTTASRLNQLLDRAEALRDLYSGLHASLGDLSHGQIGELQEELQAFLEQEKEAKWRGKVEVGLCVVGAVGLACTTGGLLYTFARSATAAKQSWAAYSAAKKAASNAWFAFRANAHKRVASAAWKGAVTSASAATASSVGAIGSGVGAKNVTLTGKSQHAALKPTADRIEHLEWWATTGKEVQLLVGKLHKSTESLHRLFFIISNGLSKGLYASERDLLRANHRQLKEVAKSVAQACEAFEQQVDAVRLLLLRFDTGNVNKAVSDMVLQWKQENEEALRRCGLVGAQALMLRS